MDYSEIIVPFIGGLAMFIFGMGYMAQGLQNAAGSKMKSILEALTHNKVMGIALGAFVTAIVQSSSATTVMVVGFVNASLMNLTQAMSVIMGANIGTTVTGWLVSSSEWMDFFSPTKMAPIIIMIGVIMQITSKKMKQKEIASIIIGFGLLFIGMDTMSSGVKPLRESQVFVDAFISMGQNPILGVLAGAVVTAIIQSSSASQGILLSLAATGLVPFNAAVYIIMGQNIGTCVTAMLSGIGANKNAKCVGFMHLTFNLIGSIIFSALAVIFFTVINPTLGSSIIGLTEISFIHTSFNVITTLLLFPFSKYIIKISKKVVGLDDTPTEKNRVYLDERMLQTPSIALEGARQETIRLGGIARKNLERAVGVLKEYDEGKVDSIKNREAKVDHVCEGIYAYLIRLCSYPLSEAESREATSLMNTLNDVERIGDHAENIAEVAEEMIAEKVKFTGSALEELDEMAEAVLASYDNALKALENGDISAAVKTAVYEDQVDTFEKQLRMGHIERLTNAECTVSAGIHFLEIITNLERVSDHAMNISEVILHEYRYDKHFDEESVVANKVEA